MVLYRIDGNIELLRNLGISRPFDIPALLPENNENFIQDIVRRAVISQQAAGKLRRAG